MTFKVAIVGGGIGGLAVGHALTRAIRDGRVQDIEVTVYEQREEADINGIQQYPIHLDPDGRKALRGILSEDDYSRMVQLAKCGIEHGGISISTPKMKRMFKMRQHEDEQPQFIHRWLLKEILSEGVTIVRGRKVIRVQNTVGAGSPVQVEFDDGGCKLADLVIGADGIGSVIRSQKYPSHAKFARLPYLNLQMKLSTDLARLPKVLDSHGINIILGKAKYSILLVPIHNTSDLSKQLTLHNGDSACSSETGPNNDPYLFAILTTHTFDGWQDLTDAGWADKVVRLLEADQADRDLFHAFMEDIIPGSIAAPWRVARCDPSDPVPYDGGRVILIGDAAHVMPPQAGAGASTALLDAFKLSEVMLSSNELGGKAGTVLDLLPAFHCEMKSRANRHVKDATRRLYLSNQSGLGVYSQRATLRLMDTLWPIAKWMSRKSTS